VYVRGISPEIRFQPKVDNMYHANSVASFTRLELLPTCHKDK